MVEYIPKFYKKDWLNMILDGVFRWVFMNLRYFGNPPWDTNQSPPELLEFIQTRPAGKALDLGCGTGTNCLTLAEAGWQTTGVDLAYEAIRKARMRFKRNGWKGEFIAMNILRYPAEANSFDLVLDIGCFHSLPSESRPVYRQNINHWLRPGGTFLIYGHRMFNGWPDGTRLSEEDINGFQEGLKLEDRKDCMDKIGRESVWLRFMKPDK